MKLPDKTAKALGWAFPPPATMTREQAVEYVGSRQIFDDLIEAGWIVACARKGAQKTGTRGRGDTCLYATDVVVHASRRMVTDGYPPVSRRVPKKKADPVEGRRE